MGVVYCALDLSTGLPYALKTLQQRFAGNSRALDLFAAEAAIWVSVEKHPFVARAYRVPSFDGFPHVVAEYVQGRPGKGSDLSGWDRHG
jgi:serine/threonine protein kinase